MRSNVEIIGKTIIYFVGLLWIVAGLYGLIIQDNKVGWWFIIGGLLVLLGKVVLDEEKNDPSKLG